MRRGELDVEFSTEREIFGSDRGLVCGVEVGDDVVRCDVRGDGERRGVLRRLGDVRDGDGGRPKADDDSGRSARRALGGAAGEVVTEYYTQHQDVVDVANGHACTRASLDDRNAQTLRT